MNLSPMLFKTCNEVFDDPEYIYEVKWDGFRCIAQKNGDHIQLFSRNGWEMSHNFPEIVRELKLVPRDFIVDGELIILREGRDDFAMLQWRGRLRKLEKINHAAQMYPATLILFDVLAADGQHVIHLPLLQRKEILARLISDAKYIRMNDWVIGKGTALFVQTEQEGREGIVAKRKNGRYYPGKRVGEWLKIKHWRVETVTVVGYRIVPDFGLLVTVQGRDVSVIRQGIKPEEKDAFLQVAHALIIEEKKGSYMLEPLLRCVVQFKEWTEDGRMRHPLFLHFAT